MARPLLEDLSSLSAYIVKMGDLLPLEHFAPDLVSIEAYNALSDADKIEYERNTIVPAYNQLARMQASAKGHDRQYYTMLIFKVLFYMRKKLENKSLVHATRAKITEVRTSPIVDSTELLDTIDNAEVLLNEIDPPQPNIVKLVEAIKANDIEYVREHSESLSKLTRIDPVLLFHFLLASNEIFNMLVLSGYKISRNALLSSAVYMVVRKNMDKKLFKERIQALFGYPGDITTVRVFVQHILLNSNLSTFQYIIEAMDVQLDDSMIDFKKRPLHSEFILRNLIEKQMPLGTHIYSTVIDVSVKWILENDPMLLDGYLNRISAFGCDAVLKSMPKGPYFTKVINHFIQKKLCMKEPTFHYIIQNGTLEDVKLLLAVPEFQDSLESFLSVETTQEIKDFLMQEMKRLAKGIWMGWSKGDVEKLDTIFGEDPNKWSVCPVCLKYTERTSGCMYMKHNCVALGGFYHKRLYEMYSKEPPMDEFNEFFNGFIEDNNNMNGGGHKQKGGGNEITWCTICNRICVGHRHYELNSAESTTYPKKLKSGDSFEPDCRKSNNGGGLPEKIARFRRLREYAADLNKDVGKITKTEAMEDLVEQMWNAPFYKTRKVQQIEQTKKWNISSNVFPANKANAQKENVNAPNIPRPNANKDLLPILIMGEDPITLDDIPVVEFHHRRKNGTINLHTGNGIGLDSLKSFLTDINKQFGTSEFGYCWNYGNGPDQCDAILHPDEVQKAFELFGEPNADLVSQYRRHFNKKFQAPIGGKRTIRKTRKVHRK